MAQNLDRRHLSATQRAVLADELEPLYAAEAKERQQSGKSEDGAAGGRGKKKTLPKKLGKVSHEGEAAAKAAKETGSNRQYVSDVKRIKNEAPELYAKMEAGKIELREAKQEIKEQKKAAVVEQIKQEPKPLPDGPFRVQVIDPPWKYESRAKDTTHRARNPALPRR